jgi:tRNA-Thr(GGU) m(6)t(6)A37 methyltransferase TsaA
MSHFQFEQIGVIRSPYKEKFAVPRQPGLVKSACGELHLLAPYNQADAVRGLEAFSHLWVIFVFHQTMEGGWRPTVRPPVLVATPEWVSLPHVQRFVLTLLACRWLSCGASAAIKST